MNFVKREDQSEINQENYKAHMESIQKSQMDTADYQHTPISMEQIHQAMQSSLNFQLPLSPRQMSTLMLKTNHLSRHLNFNDIPAHLPRNLATEIELAQNLVNENLRQDDIVRSLDLNLARTLSNEIELQNSLTQSLVQNLSEQDLHRNLTAELGSNLMRSNEILPANIGRSVNGHDLTHELDLSLHMNRQNIDHDILSQDDSRRTPMIVQGLPDSHLLEQNLSQRIEQTLVQKLEQNLAQRLDHNIAHRLEQSLAQRLDQNIAQRLEQNLSQRLDHNISQRSEPNLAQRIDHNIAQRLEQNLPHRLDSPQRLEHNLSQRLDPNIAQRLEHNLAQRLDPNFAQRLEQNLAQRLDPNIAQRLEQTLAHRLDQNIAQRLEHNLTQRLDSELTQRLDQRLLNAGLHLQESNTRALVQDEHNMLPMPFHIKAEQDDDGYFYDTVSQDMENVNGVNAHIGVHSDQNQSASANLHQSHQMFTDYNNHVPNLAGLNIDLYTRQHNYVQNYANARDNPQNLVVHRQFDNVSPYQEKARLDGAQNGIKTDAHNDAKNEHPKENLKPTENKLYYGNYDIQYANHSDKNSENDSSAQNKLFISDELSMNIKGEYVCYKCNEIFPSKRGLKQHAKTCSELVDTNDMSEKIGKFTCTQCSYRCQSPAILKIHERIHSGEKPFSCTFCDYKSGQKNNVAKHILVHMKEKPFRCQYCEYRCAQKNNLVVHERTHTGYKPFACPSCAYRTVQKPNLVKHMYLHTDQKPFSCDLCSYRCVQKTNLTKHKQRHYNEKSGEKVEVKNQNKPYRPRQKSVKCPQCPYRCVQKSSLDKHIQFKHGELNGDYNQDNYDQGLNLMKSDQDEVCSDETIHNLSVKKDEQLFSDMCQDKVIESLQIQS